MSKRFLDAYENGIQFEGENTFIAWGTPFGSLGSIGEPQISIGSDRTEFFWRNASLLGGITGNWSAMYYTGEANGKFQEISITNVGDIISDVLLESYREHLSALLGPPDVEDLMERDKHLEWKTEKLTVFVYYFEMHCFRIVLSIQLNDRVDYAEYNKFVFALYRTWMTIRGWFEGRRYT